MRFDPKRLVRDAERAQRARPGSLIGREITGVTRAVRDSLPVIHRLRDLGVTWAAIAQAMSEQGATQNDGKPLSVTRLTAIVSEVEAQMRRSAQDRRRRRQRPDLAPPPGDDLGTTGSRSGSDSPGDRPRSAHVDPNSATTEEQMRRAGLAELRKILKPE
ncbi:hypothetical protein [Methylobacterium fujisawaense]